MGAAIRIGLIADTHGLLRPDVHRALAGVSMILHAGDVCGDEILDELNLIAPTQAVFGNCDEPWNGRLTERLDLEVGGVRIHVSHGHELGRPRSLPLRRRTRRTCVCTDTRTGNSWSGWGTG